jgi:hypothetical protein
MNPRTVRSQLMGGLIWGDKCIRDLPTASTT